MHWRMKKLRLSKFPFFDGGFILLEHVDMSMQRLDEDVVFDGVITDTTNDIINSFTKNKITPINKMRDVDGNDEYEVTKFYLTLFMLKSMPSATMYKYWIKTYMVRFEEVLNSLDLDLVDISTIFTELKMPHKFLKLENQPFLSIKINDYLDFAILIKPNDKRYQHLQMVNLAVWKGRVFIPVNEINNFKLIIIKLVENKIHELFDRLKLQFRSQKIDRLVKELQGYIVKDPSFVAKPKQLEYGEVTPQMQVLNDKFVSVIKSKPGYIEEANYPPCVNRLFNKLLKKERLGHPENILLASYMCAKGFTKEQMIDIFMLAPNADPKKIDYNLDYVLERKLKPYNCNKADEYKLCYKDETCERLNLTNPMSYRK